MKKLIILSSVSILLIAGTSVVFADVGVKKVPKTECSVELGSIESLIFVMKKEFNALAVLPEAIYVPTGISTFISVKKPIYADPKVDRKWVWFYSVNYNI